jgi:hypothetical protein
MRRVLLPMCLMAAVLAVGACSTGGTPTSVGSQAVPERMPHDFGGRITYREGSVPPEYHYEWVLDLSATEAVINWRPGYDEDLQPWTATVALTADQRAQLYEGLRAAGVFNPIDEESDQTAGGPTGSVELTVAGRTYHPRLGTNKPSGRVLTAVREAVVTTLPAEVWQDFRSKQESWTPQ